MFVEKMKAEIQKQVEAEHQYSPVRGCAAQLTDIVGENETLAQLVCEDFAADQTVQKCEREIKAFVDKNHRGQCGYCPPQKAEEIIRNFFGLGAKTETAAAPQKAKIINLADLL